MEIPITTSVVDSRTQWISEESDAPQRDTQKRRDLGQFLTPTHVADLMASFFDAQWRNVDLLDAGAGKGALTAALVRRLCRAEHKPKRVTVTAYEIDDTVITSLRETLDDCRRCCESAGIDFSAKILNEDFISAAVSILRADLFSQHLPHFNVAIVNPPYRKLRSDSKARLWLRSIGIETSNYYSGFVALILRMLVKGGELVAITPRSFCNGPYFKPFRHELLEAMSLRQLHLFHSRSAAFGNDNVLQENIIVHAVKGEPVPTQVVLSSSSGQANAQVIEHGVPYSQVISPNDPEQFIHFTAVESQQRIASFVRKLGAGLADLELTVSTGRVVDFRARAFLRKEPTEGAVPLIYPCHFNGGSVTWPKKASRKHNAIMIDEKTRELLLPPGIYVLVKRFSSKEERRRIVACTYNSDQIPSEAVAFENHLNYFHIQGHGLPLLMAMGLTAFLNSTIVDSYFRQFSGHTQVNATDLRRLNYPSRAVLESLGGKIRTGANQSELDDLIEREIL